ncbi:MAG: hypothetical protein IPN92_16060 [Chromatiaceae bacterium]|nr:hypothetical protein [Chromatiaceae bacterium]
MFAIRQTIDDPQEFIPVPPELRHRRTEVIFIALDPVPEAATLVPEPSTPASLAGSWAGEALERGAAVITAFRGSGPKGTTADLLRDRKADRRREK